MLKTSEDIRNEIADERIQAKALVDLATEEKRDLTDEEQTAFDAHAEKADDLEESELPKALKREDLVAKARQAAKLQARVDSGEIVVGSDSSAVLSVNDIVVPARAKAHRKLKAFDSEKDAFIAGNVILAGIYGNQKATQFCNDYGLNIYGAQSEGIGTKGGFLVPQEMQTSLVRLREERGVFSRYARSYPMASDSLFVPRDINDVTAYWVGEASAITESDDDLGAAELIAKKLGCLTKVSSELDEDSVVDIGDMVTRSMAYAMADKIDEAGFNGDGTSTYGGVTGLKSALHANATSDAASGNVSAATLDLADFEDTAGLLPEYAGTTNVWFMHKQFYYASIVRLQNASGGTTGMEIGAGQERQIFGYPVVFSQVMPSAPGVSTICAYLGDLSLAATVGVRRSVRTQVSVDRYFENDQIGIKCTERVAINVHERGSTIKQRPIVCLKTAAS